MITTSLSPTIAVARLGGKHTFKARQCTRAPNVLLLKKKKRKKKNLVIVDIYTTGKMFKIGLWLLRKCMRLDNHHSSFMIVFFFSFTDSLYWRKDVCIWKIYKSPRLGRAGHPYKFNIMSNASFTCHPKVGIELPEARVHKYSRYSWSNTSFTCHPSVGIELPEARVREYSSININLV